MRWAWRLFRREWRQQVLVLALVTVAVAAAVAGSAIVVNSSSAAAGGFGDANGLVRLDATDAAAARAAVAAARQRFGSVEVIAHSSLAVPGSATRIDVRAEDPNGIFGHPLLALRSGRYPTKRAEVAITEDAATLLSVDVGQHLAVGRVQRTVVGLVENPRNLSDEFVLLAPGDVADAESLTLLLQGAHGGGDGGGRRAGAAGGFDFPVEVHGDERAAVAAGVLVAMTLAMVLVGLVAAAGFVVVAQRRQRQLGLLAAIGATERHLRLVTLANGAIVGAAGAVLGAALGVIGWIVAAPAVESVAGHRLDRLALPWGLILASILLAVVMATGAAWWPARSLARLPVMRALSGRPSRPRPVHRSLILAVVLIVAGIAGIAASRPSANVRPLLLMGGIVAVVFGVVFAGPAAIRALAAPAGRLPFAPRLALRDLARYQARAAAAVAAITLGLGIAVTVVVVARANQYRNDEGNLSDRQLLIQERAAEAAIDPNLGPADLRRLDASAARITTAIGDSAVFPLDIAMARQDGGDKGAGNVPTAVDVAREMGSGPASTPGDRARVSFRFVDHAYVATPALLRRYGIDPSTVDAATDLITSSRASTEGPLLLLNPAMERQAPTHIQQVTLSTFSSAPRSLVTLGALRRNGWVRARAGWLVESAKPLTTQQVAAARAAAAEVGLTVEARSAQDELAALRTGATTTGAILAMAIVAMTIGLIRGEAARDMRTLTAAGAAPRTRRAVTASTAAAVALLGAVLGTAGAYVALLAGYHAQLTELARPPIGNLVLLVVGLPLVAALAGWLLAGREPAHFARQALE